MKQLHERFMASRAYRESNPGEVATISSINSINLRLLRQLRLVLTVCSLWQGAATTSALARRKIFWK